MTKAITHLSNVNAGDDVETSGVLPVAAGGTGRTDDLLTQTIDNGDTTHAPSGDAVFDALALKQDAVADSGWQAATLENSWVNFGTPFVNAEYRKVGKVVSMRGVIKSGTITDGTTVLTLPSGYRPPATQIFVSQIADRFDVAADGTVKLYGVPNNSYQILTASFFID